MIGTGRTALAVLEVAALRAGEVVAVPAAAGGLGTLLVQAALRAGADVLALAGGPAKVAQVRSLGVGTVVDVRAEDWEEALASAVARRAPDVLLDGVGGPVGAALLAALGSGGRVVVHGWASGTPLAIDGARLAAGSLTASGGLGPRVLAGPGGIGGLRAWEERALATAAAGELVPLVERWPLADAAGAHRAMEARRTAGKVVLVP